jgi:NADH-quinone oxidoreductase subunit L
MGGLKKHLPITFWTFAIGTSPSRVSAARRVLLEGRDSLEDVLERTRRAVGVAVVAAFLTATYMFRLLYSGVLW